MADYKRIQWSDRIKDQNGNTLQEGTPLSSKNFNRMEKGISDIALEVTNTSNAIRETIPSGFTRLNNIDYDFSSCNPNKIKFSNDGIAFINGWKVVIPSGTIIDIGEPPTYGKREDFIFLECWFDVSTNELKWRIRVTNGVDFNFYEADGLCKNIVDTASTGVNFKTSAQGGNTQPLTITENTDYTTRVISTFHSRYQRANIIGQPLVMPYISIEDGGLYIAGSGTQVSKDTLKTYDGYVYVIPMFKVLRRNSAPYSDVNPNGGLKYIQYLNVINMEFYPNQVLDIKLNTTTGLNPNDLLHYLTVNSDYIFKVISIIDDTTAKLQVLKGYGIVNPGGRYFEKSRPDFLYSDVIDKTDIIDLRHKVSLVGLNYQSLLEENFDLALRGELQTNVYGDLIKTYHGVRKTPVDSNTIFYASFDGVNATEIGGQPLTNINFKPFPTGLGLARRSNLEIPVNINNGVFTVECFFECTSFNYDTIWFLNGTDSDCGGAISNPYIKGNILVVDIMGGGVFTTHIAGLPQFCHLRVVHDLNNSKFSIYLNGVLRFNGVVNIKPQQGYNYTNYSKIKRVIVGPVGISDLSISNIDRGNSFATLPQDFINGSAKITSAFNEQRSCLSDSIIAETKEVRVLTSDQNPRYLNLKQTTPKVWSQNDTLKIKGLAGELISGVIDNDTVLAKFSDTPGQFNTGTPIKVTNLNASLAVGDTIMLSSIASGINPTTIAAIDNVNSTITLSNTVIINNGCLIVETTTSSSTPLLQMINSNGTLTNVAGTWSNLGTSEATFTFGYNPGLTNQDLLLQYGLIEPQGQGAFNDIPYQILGGEINGQKLVLNTNGPHIVDDFKGKACGSIVENPNTAYLRGLGYVDDKATSLLTPSDFQSGKGYIIQNDYDQLNSLDGKLMGASSATLNGIPQALFSFNVIEIIERKYGKIPALNKVQWLKNNIARLGCRFYGYGKGPKGNKIYLKWWTGTWTGNDNSPSYWTNTASGVSMNIPWTGDWFPDSIDANGFTHILAHSDPSDGVTTSQILIDYLDLQIILKTPSPEYDVITPANPRRDDGLSIIGFIRKETNELRFPLVTPINCITYGSYLPYQGIGVLPKSGLYPLTDWKVVASCIGTGGYDPKGNAWACLYKGLYSMPLYNRDDLVKFCGTPITILGNQTSLTRVGYHHVGYNSYPSVLYPKILDVGQWDKYFRGYKMDNFIGAGDAINGVYGIHPDVPILGSYYLIAARLLKDEQGNILMLISKSLNDTLNNDGKENSSDTFYLKYRPMEKA